MIPKIEILAMTVLGAVFCCNQAAGQSLPATVLTIDVENFVEYQNDTSDVSRIATNPNVTTVVPPHAFFSATLIGDIVAVNGQPAKGTVVGVGWVLGLNPNGLDTSYTAGVSAGSIADTARTAVRYMTYEILQPDGTPIGTIMSLGPAGFSPPPGAPLAQRAADFAILGGTGAFLGARGQAGGGGQTTPTRAASITEDPSKRRVNGGGRNRFALHVMPLSVPQIIDTGSGPAVTHASDFAIVSSSKPAAAGEILSLFATGLGPTHPGVDPGQPFPSSPLAVINSPVEVTVNGKAAEVLGAVGYPGTVDGYQVNFRMPSDTAKGMAAVRVSAAWIPGTPVNIAVQ